MDGPQMLHAGFLPWFLACQWQVRATREETVLARVLL